MSVGVEYFINPIILGAVWSLFASGMWVLSFGNYAPIATMISKLCGFLLTASFLVYYFIHNSTEHYILSIIISIILYLAIYYLIKVVLTWLTLLLLTIFTRIAEKGKNPDKSMSVVYFIEIVIIMSVVTLALKHL